MNKLLVVAADIRYMENYQTIDAEFRWAGPEDIEKVVATGEPVASARRRIEKGARLAVAERGGRIVAYYWYQVGDFDHDDWLRFKLSPTDVWGIYAWITPELRGQGMYARIIDFAFAELARMGYNQSLGVIDALHRNSIRAAAKIRGRPFGSIWFIRILGLTLVRFDHSVRVGWWGPRRRLELPIDGFGGNLDGANSRADCRSHFAKPQASPARNDLVSKISGSGALVPNATRTSPADSNIRIQHEQAARGCQQHPIFGGISD